MKRKQSSRPSVRKSNNYAMIIGTIIIVVFGLFLYILNNPSEKYVVGVGCPPVSKSNPAYGIRMDQFDGAPRTDVANKIQTMVCAYGPSKPGLVSKQKIPKSCQGVWDPWARYAGMPFHENLRTSSSDLLLDFYNNKKNPNNFELVKSVNWPKDNKCIQEFGFIGTSAQTPYWKYMQSIIDSKVPPKGNYTF
jgi:hypothetical protein